MVFYSKIYINILDLNQLVYSMNNSINLSIHYKEKKKESNDKYPWSDKDDEGRNMSERYQKNMYIWKNHVFQEQKRKGSWT